MVPSILMLYGPYGQHPWKEDMFARPDKIQKALHELGFGFDIALVTEPPSGKDEVPDIRVAHAPVYDQTTGILQEAHFQPGTLEDYPGIIDHWVHNFQFEVPQQDGTYQRTAFGIGLSPERLWNHKSIQTFGNRKDLMDTLLQASGVGIDTYSVLAYEEFADMYGNAQTVIYKPQGGSSGKGIEVFNTVSELKDALLTKRIASNGFIQPYLNTMNPIKGVKPATKQDASLLRVFNSVPDRPREIRMHVVTTTDDKGMLRTEAYPVMKISEPNRPFLKYERGIGIDPTCLGPGTFIHDKSVELAQEVCRAAGTDGTPIPQYYGVFDWLVDGDIYDPTAVHVVDGNCRGPGLPECAGAARDAFQRALASSATRQLRQHTDA